MLEHHALDRKQIDARCAWHDSSGMEGSYPVKDWLAPFPHLKAKLEALPPFSDWQRAARIAGRVWRVGLTEEKQQGVVIDLGTAEACVLGEGVERISLWELYQQHGCHVAPLLDWVESHV